VIDRVEPGLSIAVFGLGRVGTTTAACLAAAGHRVHGIDVDPRKIAAFASGRSPVAEPGLDELLNRAARAGLLTASPTAETVLDQLDMVLVCVGTPASPDGRFDHTALLDVLRRVGRGLRRRAPAGRPLLIVVRSTLVPGTMDRLVVPTLVAEARNEPGSHFEIAYNPEFLREGSALEDHRSPSRILLGERVPGASRRLLGIYDGLRAPLLEVSFRLAESAKLLDNCFHALKVAFANELGRIAVANGVEPGRLADLLFMDHKLNLSPAYLRPGGPYGGPCLAKDLRAASTFARDTGLVLPVLEAIAESNARHLDFLFERIRAAVAPPGPVLLIGLSFKEGTDDLRGSAGLALADRLLRADYELEAVDPDLGPEPSVDADLAFATGHPELLHPPLVEDLDRAIRRARLVVLNKPAARLLGRLPPGIPVIDIPRLRLP
jgi:GDP-mannose 6-dehydrogenase